MFKWGFDVIESSYYQLIIIIITPFSLIFVKLKLEKIIKIGKKCDKMVI